MAKKKTHYGNCWFVKRNYFQDYAHIHWIFILRVCIHLVYTSTCIMSMYNMVYQLRSTAVIFFFFFLFDYGSNNEKHNSFLRIIVAGDEILKNNEWSRVWVMFSHMWCVQFRMVVRFQPHTINDLTKVISKQNSRRYSSMYT